MLDETSIDATVQWREYRRINTFYGNSTAIAKGELIPMDLQQYFVFFKSLQKWNDKAKYMCAQLCSLPDRCGVFNHDKYGLSFPQNSKKCCIFKRQICDEVNSFLSSSGCFLEYAELE